MANGGPDGDGGRGGHIIIVAKILFGLCITSNTRNILNPNMVGMVVEIGAQDKTVNLRIEVPIGTIVKDTKTDQVICENLNHGDEKIILKGGLGGRGNWNFKSSTNQAPRYAQNGIKGKELQLTLELKILADVGLVGFPNAGKSTLLKTITTAKPKIGNYEFTTLKPNLGIVQYRDYKSFVMADIPGIIEGASMERIGSLFFKTY